MLGSYFTLAISAFIAGVFTFFAPCTLPLVPAFLGIIAGVGSDEIIHPERLQRLRWKIFLNACFYVLGFSLVFILFGVAFSLVATILPIRIWLQRIGGVAVIVFGLSLIGAIRFSWLGIERRFHVPSLGKSTSVINAFIVGVIFALGWSPCVGPLLGSILLLTSHTSTIWQGGFLLVIFSLGLAMPFLLTALLIGRAFRSFATWTRPLEIINILAGIFLVILGILLLSNEFTHVFSSLSGHLSHYEFYEAFINKFL